METVIVENITKRFGDFTAVDSASFSVAKGEIFGLLGPNGAGKSTTIKMLCGLLQPDEGTGSVGGLDIVSQQWGHKKNYWLYVAKIFLYEDLTIEENLEIFMAQYMVLAQMF